MAFRKPQGMTTPEQEARYSSALEARRAGELEREWQRGASDRAANLEGSAEIISASPIGQIPAAGADAYIAKQDIGRGDYTGAAVSGAAVLLPFVSAGMLKRLRMGGEAMGASGEAATEAARRLEKLETDLSTGAVSRSQAKRIGKDIEEQYLADDFAKAWDADDFSTTSKILSGKHFGDVVDEISPRDMGTLEQYLGRQGKDISSMSPDALRKIRDSRKFQDFELEEIRVSNELARAIDADDFGASSKIISDDPVGKYLQDQMRLR